MNLAKVVGISRHGSLEITCEGFRDETHLMTPDTSFDLGSVTKIMSTTAILMLLAGEKELALDAPVANYLPRWNSREKSRITLSHLLHHRAGLNEWVPFYLRFSDHEDVHRYIADASLKYPIDQTRQYSDLGFMTLGKIIEVVTSETLDVLFPRLISKPLHLSATQYARPVSPSNVAMTSLGDRFEREMIASNEPFPVSFEVPANYPWREYRLKGEINDGNAYRVFNGVSGHAGLFSTVPDIVRFGEALLAENSIFSTKILAQFLTTGKDPMQMAGFRSWKDGQYFGHTGFPGVALAVDIKSETVIALASNRLVTDGPAIPTDQLLKQYL